ncbi:hypothetical protein BH11PLA2_BH11PLA2_43390 [soil metagenome]
MAWHAYDLIFDVDLQFGRGGEPRSDGGDEAGIGGAYLPSIRPRR